MGKVVATGKVVVSNRDLTTVMIRYCDQPASRVVIRLVPDNTYRNSCVSLKFWRNFPRILGSEDWHLFMVCSVYSLKRCPIRSESDDDGAVGDRVFFSADSCSFSVCVSSEASDCHYRNWV